jgi:hypothetical protein
MDFEEGKLWTKAIVEEMEALENMRLGTWSSFLMEEICFVPYGCSRIR